MGLDRLAIKLIGIFNFYVLIYHQHRADPATNIRTSQMQTVGSNNCPQAESKARQATLLPISVVARLSSWFYKVCFAKTSLMPCAHLKPNFAMVGAIGLAFFTYSVALFRKSIAVTK